MIAECRVAELKFNMPAQNHNQCHRMAGIGHVWVLILLVVCFNSTARALSITNLHQLTQVFASIPQTNGDVDLSVTVCAASRPKMGVLIVQDQTGSELLEVGDFEKAILPGEQVRIRRSSCLLRKREMGVEISALPVVNNDGLHPLSTTTGTTQLPAGKIPLQLEWFNFRGYFALNITWAISNRPPRAIETPNLWRAVVTAAGQTNFLPGMKAECYEGRWEALPDFSLLQPVTTGQATNFDLKFRSRDDAVGIRYTGCLEVPLAGRYQFELSSDDGAALYLGDTRVPVIRLERLTAPPAESGKLMMASFTNADQRCWGMVEGRVSHVSRADEGLCFDVVADRHVISVRVADAAGLETASLSNARVRLTGIGRGVVTLDQVQLLGKLFVASARDLVILEPPLGPGEPALPINSAAQVQSLPIERARQSLPVHIRGIVTGETKTSQEHWMSFQDDTRGIFVRLNTITNAAPAVGELWDVQGHSGAGDFAPIVVADEVTRLGEGLLPVPINPTWTELLNGSRDVQWSELKGLVTDVHSNTISLYLPEGQLDIELEGCFESDLRQFLKANVTIRGVLYAVWNLATREVRVGRVMMRNSTISVDDPAPADPFDAVLRTPRRLLQFDVQASAFRRVKVRGLIIYADATQIFLQENGAGLRLLPGGKTTVHTGDMVEAVGYPDIGGPQLQLREVLLRKTGESALPPPKNLEESTFLQEDLNSTRVRVEGKLLAWHSEAGAPVLEMQAGTRLFLARIKPEETGPLSLRPGSRLGLVGVFAGRRNNQNPGEGNKSFEILLNSQADITVLSQPSWWTLPRMFALVGLLVVILIFTVIWNAQLRRLVEQRTIQLQHEISERKLIEQQRAIEAERSRIARDLHDDLGSSLTEISVLASTGQLPQTSTNTLPGLFQTISSKARNLISALDVIVWAVNPEDNSLQSLSDYLSGYTDEFFSHSAIACRFKVPMSFPPITIEGRVRHDLLMAVKEALNNVMRHANATEIEYRMAMVDNKLEIIIADNGKGFEGTPAGGGYGLKNLSGRLQKLGGRCVVEPRPGGGTMVQIWLPLTAATETGHAAQQ